MQHRTRWLAVALVVAGLQLAACGQGAKQPSADAAAKIEAIEGTELNRLTLTPRAAERLDIQTFPVVEEQVDGAPHKIIPYAAVIYDLKGDAWAYINPEPLTYVRQPLTIAYIDGAKVVLLDGPPAGTEVVTVGVAELYGTDTGIGK
jgi:hypothetical protein